MSALGTAETAGGGDAAELFSMAQLAPGEGIEDAIRRIGAYLAAAPAPAAVPVDVQRNAERYLWLRSWDVDMKEIDRALFQTIRDDCNPPHRAMKYGDSLDRAIDAAMLATQPQPAHVKTGHFTPDEMQEATAVLRAQQAKLAAAKEST